MALNMVTLNKAILEEIERLCEERLSSTNLYITEANVRRRGRGGRGKVENSSFQHLELSLQNVAKIMSIATIKKCTYENMYKTVICRVHFFQF
jgi:hypothetical protein